MWDSFIILLPSTRTTIFNVKHNEWNFFTLSHSELIFFTLNQSELIIFHSESVRRPFVLMRSECNCSSLCFKTNAFTFVLKQIERKSVRLDSK